MSASVTVHTRGEFHVRGSIFPRESKGGTFAALTVLRAERGALGADVNLHVIDPADLEKLAEAALALARDLRAELAAELAADLARHRAAQPATA